MTRPPLFVALAAAGTAVAAVVATPVLASAQEAARDPGAPTVEVLDTTVLAPFQLDVGKRGLYVADGGTATVSVLGDSGLTTVATGPEGGEVAGVAVNRRGDLAYTASVFGEQGAVATTLTVKRKHGGTLTVDLLGFERTENPDASVSYGIDDPTDCQEKAFEPFGGASYTGTVDSHPYAVAAYGDGWVVADAGGNDLLKVDSDGEVSTLAVLPRQPTTITADAAAALGLPDCVVGAVYNFEPVPTDVEVAGGRLVVSLLPGGPEDPSLGARGSVWTVDPRSGDADRVAGGFVGATNVAVAPGGRIFVAELFAGRVSVIDHGSVEPYVALPNALSLVWDQGVLYAGTLAPFDDQGNPSGTGSLVAIR